ncbi:MAG TPA: nucleotide-binding protein [Pyrinomonadaceae bacterium]|jgi:predicted nucleotide-binding protein|nr:nucleotide-binding protein [Pyrinomonadaceae bacterium]
MKPSVTSRLAKLIEEGENISNDYVGDRWASQVAAFLQAADASDEHDSFASLTAEDFWDAHALRVGHLQGLVAKAEADEKVPATASGASSEVFDPSTPPSSRRVFVVHGHDNDAKEGTARFLERLGLQPIVLHEQPSAGRTVIEKFESYSGDIAFAVVLLTPDDVGAVATAANDLRARARQNVIMELGFFIGRLGRVRVCALHKGGVELPSDYQGVLYVEMDPGGAWKAKLAQEFVQAKLPIDLKALIGG